MLSTHSDEHVWLRERASFCMQMKLVKYRKFTDVDNENAFIRQDKSCDLALHSLPGASFICLLACSLISFPLPDASVCVYKQSQVEPRTQLINDRDSNEIICGCTTIDIHTINVEQVDWLIDLCYVCRIVIGAQNSVSLSLSAVHNVVAATATIVSFALMFHMICASRCDFICFTVLASVCTWAMYYAIETEFFSLHCRSSYPPVNGAHIFFFIYSFQSCSFLSNSNEQSKV